MGHSEPPPARGRAPFWRGQLKVITVVSLGGGAGAAARYGATLLWPAPGGAFPWTVLGVNAVGCALVGVLLVTVTEFRVPHPLLLPFLAPGVLGGFTTFSAYAGEVERLLRHGRAPAAAGYLVLTPLAALAAVWLAAVLTRRTLARGWRVTWRR